MKKNGFSLVELTVSISIMLIISAALFGFSIAVGQATRSQQAKVTATDDARQAILVAIREIRQSAFSSINWGSLPANTVQYRIALDADNNGLAVDSQVRLELSAVRTISPDFEDINNDGITARQLIMTDGLQTQVLCNTLRVSTSGAAEDEGVWFEQNGAGLRITVQTESGSVNDIPMPCRLVEFVIPRN